MLIHLIYQFNNPKKGKERLYFTKKQSVLNTIYVEIK